MFPQRPRVPRTYVAFEAFMWDFGERLIKVDLADRKDVKLEGKEFDGVNVSGLPLFSQENPEEGTEEEEDISF